MMGLGRCKEISLQVVRSEHEALPAWQALQLRLHLMMCRGCSNFRGQMRLLSAASARWRHYGETPPKD
ncbi:hypothetical protein [Inhella inkyongensis]|nr:hypothetical protein [Inhella inkyongensis]